MILQAAKYIGAGLATIGLGRTSSSTAETGSGSTILTVPSSEEMNRNRRSPQHRSLRKSHVIGS